MLSKQEIERILELIDDDKFLTDYEKVQTEFKEKLLNTLDLCLHKISQYEIYELARKLLCVYPNSLTNRDKTKEYFFIEKIENRTTMDDYVILLEFNEEINDYKPLVVSLQHFAYEFFNMDLEKAKDFLARPFAKHTNTKETETQETDEIIEVDSRYGKVYKDKNGNMWSVRNKTKNDVLALSKTLVNCKDCFECIDCENCESCYKCDDCKDCKNCRNCFSCRNCVECLACHTCKDCLMCEECGGSKDCEECYETHNSTKCVDVSNAEKCKDCNNCEYITNCENCFDCQDCHNSKNLASQSGVDNNKSFMI